MKLQNIKAILFDLDDTLLQTSKTRYGAVKLAGKKFFGLDISDDLIRQHWGKPFQEFVREIYGDVDFEDAKQKYQSIIHLFPNEAYADTHEVLLQLLEKYPLGIVSSATKVMVLESIAVVPISIDHYTYIQTADETNVHKPDPAVFVPAIERFSQLGIEASDILYVGDGPHDFHAAVGAGMKFIGIADRTTPKSTFDGIGAQTVSSLTELLEILYEQPETIPSTVR